MTAIAYPPFRQHVADVVENLIHDGEPAIITRAGGKNLILLMEKDWESLSETVHLLSSEENANRLRASLEGAKSGRLTQRYLAS